LDINEAQKKATDDFNTRESQVQQSIQEQVQQGIDPVKAEEKHLATKKLILPLMM
jgi:hypothetical protein